MRRVALAGGAVALALAALEIASWCASRAFVPVSRSGAAAPPRVEAIVVLGCPSRRDGTPSRTQRYRTRVAVRSRDPRACRRLLIFSGRTLGAFRGVVHDRTEAEVMAEYAIGELGVDPADVIVEPAATSTRQNIEFALPLMRDLGADAVLVASTPFHARRGRVELRALAPDLAGALRRADDHRVGEAIVLRLFDAAYESRRAVYLAIRGR